MWLVKRLLYRDATAVGKVLTYLTARETPEISSSVVHKENLIFGHAVTNCKHVAQAESRNMKLSEAWRRNHASNSDNKQLKLTDMLKSKGNRTHEESGHSESQDACHCYKSDEQNTAMQLKGGGSLNNHGQELKRTFKFTKMESYSTGKHSESHLFGSHHRQSEEQKVQSLGGYTCRVKQRSKSENLTNNQTTGENEGRKSRSSADILQVAQRNQPTHELLQTETIQILGACSLEHKQDMQRFKSTPKITIGKTSWNSESQASQARQSTTEKRNSITTNIPPAIAEPEIRRITSTEFNIVVFDLETTSRGEDAEICQIAATDGLDDFDIYVVPKGKISRGASAVNKLRKKRGVLLHSGRRVTAVRQNVALAQFLKWLKFKTPCMLIAHNGRAFDAKHLIKAMTSCYEMKEFNQSVLGFSDTLTAFRERFPNRKSYSQTSLAKDLLGATYNAHNALDDAKMLHKLLAKFISNDLLLKHSFTVSWYREYSRYIKQKNENLETLEPLIRSGRISAGTAQKVAGSGLDFNHLQLSFRNGGTDGLRNVLTEMSHEKPRVTNNKKILTEICNFFQENVER